jgi:hypothetical protein
MINGIAIQNAGLILVQVSVTSFILILMGALVALHYRERTAAQFIFSTALVVVMLFALALPDNPLNLLTRLAVGTAGVEQWFVLGVTMLIVLGLGLLTHRYAERVGRTYQYG